MSLVLNPFAGDGFSLAEMTAAINLIPNKYGRLNELGLFREEGVTTDIVLAEENNGVLNLLPSVPRGGPATVGISGRRKVRPFLIPHIPHNDVVLPSDVQGKRAFGTSAGTDTVAALVARKLENMRAKHAITLEFMRMGAIKGILIDGDAATTLYNFYTEFTIAPKTVDFALDDEDTDVRAKCLEVVRHIDLNLKGEIRTGVRALVSPEFFDALTSHPNVHDAFGAYQVLGQNLAEDYRSGFRFGGITFEEYSGSATTPDAVSHPFIVAGEGHAFPEGTNETFRTYFAPGDFNDTVNSIGLPMYARQEERKFGQGWDIHTESNPLPICLRPGVLVKLTS